MAVPVIAFAALFVGCAQTDELNGGISGRVVNGLTGAPVRRVGVRIQGRQLRQDEYTDGEGRFSFRGVPPGEYTILTRRDGYSDRTYVIGPADFENRQPVVIKLVPLGVITGKVIDGNGEPLMRVHISALTYGFRNGRRELVKHRAGAETDDQGEYRLNNLDPGSYFIRASYRGGRRDLYDVTPVSWASATYGSSDEALGKPVRIVRAAEIPGIDFKLTPAKPPKIQGIAQDINGALVEHASLWITPLDPASVPLRGNNGDVRKGRFTIPEIAPGRYLVSAETIDGARMFGVVEVRVNKEDVDGVQLILKPSPVVDGKIRMVTEGAALPAFDMILSRTDGIHSFGPTIIRPRDGAFGNVLHAGEYAFDLNLPPRTFVQSVLVNGKPSPSLTIKVDSSSEDQTVEIVLGNAPGAISGFVNGGDAERGNSRTVILLPDSERRSNVRLFRTTRTDSTGRFSFTVVPPGKYTLVSTGAEDGEWLAPEFWKVADREGVKIEVVANETAETKLNFVRRAGVE